MKKDLWQPTVSAAPGSSKAEKLWRELYHPRSEWRTVQREAAQYWLGIPRRGKRMVDRLDLPPWAENLIGVALAERRTKGRHTGDAAITLLVTTKLPKKQVPKRLRLPGEIDGYPTDVVEVGVPRFAEGLPVQAGTAIGTPFGNWGTLGAYLSDAQGKRYAITNAHVVNAGPGTPVFCPRWNGPGSRQIGTVRGVIPPIPGIVNEVDLALIEIDSTLPIEPALPQIGSLTGVTPPDPQQRVRMAGAASGPVSGWLHSAQTNVSIPIGSASYGFRAIYYFWAAGAGVFGRPGDSGAVIVDDNSQAAIAQLFAVGVDCAFGIPFGVVASKLNGLLFL